MTVPFSAASRAATLDSTAPWNASGIVERLLAAGAPGQHPASAAVGLRLGSDTDVATGGWATLPAAGDAGTPMQPSLLLDLASVTKVAGSTALTMLLADRGELGLDQQVRRFLPAFAGGVKDEVTLEQLLTHTAGLQPWWPLYCQTTQRAEALDSVASMPLVAEPGTVWRYSDLGLILAGEVIEAVTGMGLAEAFRRLVADPLGLTARYGPVAPQAAAASSDGDTYEHTMVATGDPFPVPFSTADFAGWRTGPLRGVVNDGNAAHALANVAGHAGLFATIDDLLTLGSALRGGGFVSRTVLERFARPTPINPVQAVGFRLARLEVAGETAAVLHHGGFTGTFFAIGLDTELVIAAGAMRLYGTLGLVPALAQAPDRSGLLTTAAIESLLLDAARTALARTTSHPAPPVEEP